LELLGLVFNTLCINMGTSWEKLLKMWEKLFRKSREITRNRKEITRNRKEITRNGREEKKLPFRVALDYFNYREYYSSLIFKTIKIALATRIPFIRLFCFFIFLLKPNSWLSEPTT